MDAMIVGPGWVAGEHIKGYVRDPRTRITAVVGFRDEDADQCEAYRRQYGFEGAYYDDLDKALAETQPHVASICTLNSQHHAHALAAVRAGANVFCEKPLALTAEHVDELVAAAAEHKAFTHVGHIVRWYSAVAALKKRADEGEFGQFYYGEVDYYHQFAPGWKTNAATAGSAWMMGGIHGVDLLLHFMGYDSPIEEVYCVSQPARWRTDFDYPTCCCAIVRFADGRIGKLATNAESNMPYVFALHLNGTKGSIRQANYYTDAMPEKRMVRQDGLYPDDWNVAEHPFAEEISFFLDCIESGRDSPLCFARAAKCYHLIFAMDASASKGEPVRFTRN